MRLEERDADDEGPEPEPLASCGDPSCGDRCAHYDDPWCTTDGTIIRRDGSPACGPIWIWASDEPISD